MIYEKIYLDMDGVLADFDRGVVEICGMKLIPQGKRTEAQNIELWSRVREVGHFYRKLEPIPGAIEMFHTLWEKYGNRLEILTGIPEAKWQIETSGNDKKEWAAEFLNKEVVVNTVYRADKIHFAKNPACILIDDYARNIKEWETKGNGTGILFTTAEDALKQLAELETE